MKYRPEINALVYSNHPPFEMSNITDYKKLLLLLFLLLPSRGTSAADFKITLYKETSSLLLSMDPPPAVRSTRLLVISLTETSLRIDELIRENRGLSHGAGRLCRLWIWRPILCVKLKRKCIAKKLQWSKLSFFFLKKILERVRK